MADLLLDSLPETMWEGRKINSDFRPMVWLANQYLRGAPDKDPLLFSQEAFRRFFREDIPLPQSGEAFQSMLRFYVGGEAATPEARRSVSSSAGSHEVAFDYASDAPYIVAAFQQTYGIDLTNSTMHWWRFRALFLSLPEDTLMHKIMCQNIDRENDREALKTILKCIQLLKTDEVSVGVFPEGYTSHDGKVHQFRSGVFKIATKAQVPIVVCGLQNTETVFHNRKRLKTTKIPLRVAGVIQPETYQGRTAVDISQEAYEMMLSVLPESFRAAEEE